MAELPYQQLSHYGNLLIQLKKILPNNEILLNGFLIPKLLNNPLAS